MRGRLWLRTLCGVILPILTGCSVLFDARSEVGTQDAFTFDQGTPVDAETEDAGVREDGSVEPAEVGVVDGDQPPPGPDAGLEDTGPTSECFSTGAQTRMLLTTSTGGQRIDELGAASSLGPFDVAPEPVASPCGTGQRFDDDIAPVIIAAADNHQLADGRLSFWVRFDPGPGALQGIISRDANNAALEGHLTVFRTCSDYLLVRLQFFGDYYQCSALPISRDEWNLVKVTFGDSLQLSINDVPQTNTATIAFLGTDCDVQVQCGGTVAGGIDGNANPWVIGRSANASIEGGAEPLTFPFFGAIGDIHLEER